MQIIRGLQYRHIAGYLRVVGSTKYNAEWNTKKVGRALVDKLPPGTVVKPGRYRGIKNRLHVFEVPVILNRSGVREILESFATEGSVPKLSS
jgi:hypothetical protein